MKILIITAAAQRGSIGKIVTTLSKGYLNAGHEVRICYGHYLEDIENDIYKKITSNLEFKLSALLSRITGYEGIFNLLSTRKLIKNIQEFKPDIVQIFNLHAYYINGFKVLRYLKANKIHTVYCMMDEYAFLGKCAFSYNCENYKTECHNCPNWRDYPKSLFFNHAKEIYKWKKEIYKDFKTLHFVGGVGLYKKATEAPLLKNFNIVPIDEPQDFDSLFYPRDVSNLRIKLGIPENNIVVLCVASLKKSRKGGPDFIKLCKKMEGINGYSFVLVGYDNENYKIPDNMIAIPYVSSSDELAEYYSLGDVLFFGSYADTTPNTILQAMGCGTPVICYDIEGVSCLQNDESVFQLVKSGDIDAAKYRLLQIRKKNNKTIVNSRNNVYKQFSSKEIVEKYLYLFNSIKR